MKSYVVAIRHAKPKVEGYASDALYPLSEEGIKQQKKLAKILYKEGFYPDKIYTSFLLRAVESAQILSDRFEIPYQEEAALGPSFDENVLLKLIPKRDHTLFLIGHAPTLAEFIEALVGKKILKGGIGKSCAAICEFNHTIGFGQAKFVKYLSV